MERTIIRRCAVRIPVCFTAKAEQVMKSLFRDPPVELDDFNYGQTGKERWCVEPGELYDEERLPVDATTIVHFWCTDFHRKRIMKALGKCR